MDSHIRWEFPPISQHVLLSLVFGRIPPKLTSMSTASKGVFPAKYRLSIEKMPAIICKRLDWPEKTIVTVSMYNLLEQPGIFSLDNLYLAGKAPLLVREMLANFDDILPETSKSSPT